MADPYDPWARFPDAPPLDGSESPKGIPPGGLGRLAVDPRMAEQWGKVATGMPGAVLDSIERLMKRGYEPGQKDTQAVDDAFTAASLAGTGRFAASRAVADAGSLGVFIGRTGAENMAKAGRPTALKALDMAERMDAKGIPERSIREATNALIAEQDARLGGVHKGEDGKWRVELDDSQARFRQAGPPKWLSIGSRIDLSRSLRCSPRPDTTAHR
jgi:hypothetical protein